MLSVRAIVLAILVLAAPARRSSASDVFSWRRFEGTPLKVVLARNPLGEAIVRRLPEFEATTGIRAVYAMLPEADYFRRLADGLDGGPGRPDAFMVHVPHAWKLAADGRMQALDGLLLDPALTRAGYNPADFIDKILAPFRWKGESGDPAGEDPLWAVPLGFASAVLIYDQIKLARIGLGPPTTIDGFAALLGHLQATYGPGSCYFAPGDETWRFFESAFLPLFAEYGAAGAGWRDGLPVPRVNSPAAVAAAELWIGWLREYGHPALDSFNLARPDEAGGAPPILFLELDARGFRANLPGASPLAGRLGFAPLPFSKDGEPVPPVLSAWGLGLGAESDKSGAAWLFAEYFTGAEFQVFMAAVAGAANPSRHSVLEHPGFLSQVNAMDGYAGTLALAIEKGDFLFAPSPHVHEAADRWACALRSAAVGASPSARASLDRLKSWMEEAAAGGRLERK
jgi:multiple sugar transport system substrate-binding protein